MIGDGIKLARKRSGLSQMDLCGKIECTQSHLSQIETGLHKPSWGLLEKISESLDVPIPIICWLGFKREEISDEKKKIFDIIKPAIDEALKEISF
tara:strand:- start:619 stop:903 length:285 start_codon:yes stop_codon:yes gene_type:complete